MKLSLIFPVYNETGSITTVLEGFSQYCLNKSIDHEIVVVDDGSRDDTYHILQAFARAHPVVKIAHHQTNQGYGAALRSGFSAATGDFVFFTDSDGQFRADDLEQTLQVVAPQAMVLGYRQHRAEGVVRRLNAWLWTRVIALTLNVQARDLNCAWKVFPRSFLTDITLVSRGAFINAELLYYAKQKKLTFKEIPVHHYPRQSGSPTGANIKVIWRAFRELGYFLQQRSHATTPSPASLRG